MRRCKCKICKKELTTDIAYKITNDKGKNSYYCSKEEYDNYIENKKVEKDCKLYIAECMRLKFCTPFVLKEINKLLPYYSYIVIKRTFKDNLNSINWFLDNNDNATEFSKVRYIFTIIQNNIAKSEKQYKKEQEKMISLFEKSKNDIEIDIINNINKSKEIKKNIHDISQFLDD